MDPRYGILAGGVPLPPRRPNGIGSEGSDLPMRAPRGSKFPNLTMEEFLRQDMGKQNRDYAQRQQQGHAQLQQLKQQYPYGAGFPETSPSFPRPEGQNAISEINQHFDLNRIMAQPSEETPETSYFGKGQLPPEYQPERPIPLGELQRRWGVPRFEDL